MNNTILYIAVIILAIFEIVQQIRHAELKNRFEHLQKESRKYLEIFEQVTNIVESTERMSSSYTEQNNWFMSNVADRFVQTSRTINNINRELDELGKTYESLSKRNELLDKELRNACKCCSDMQQRMEMILTPPQVKPMPIPEEWLNSDPNQFQKPYVLKQVWQQNDSISESILPNCQTDPVGFLGKAIQVAQSTAAAVSGLKDLAETAVDAVKESIDSVPDPDEFEPEEWSEEETGED